MRMIRIQTILIVCNKENTALMLEEALNLAMLSTPPYHWMFYDPGLESLDALTMYTQIQVNFTVISLVDFNDTLKPGNPSNIESALTSDAFKVLASASANLDFQTSQNNTRTELSQAIKQNQASGRTGVLAFDTTGHRVNVTLTLSTVSGDRTYPRGMWYSDPSGQATNLNMNTAIFPLNQTRPFPLVGRKVKVVVIENKPFTMLKKDHETKKGNDKFEGYSIDLIEYVAKELQFDYELYLVHDGKFGSQMPNGKWNGVMGELIAGNASMSVAPLSINADRERAVDFTKPFMTRHISVLMRIPTYESSYFQFLNPFSKIVWMIIMVAFVIVSWILYALEKIGRSLDKHTSEDLPEVTVRETFWFIFGSLVQGGTDSVASSLPGRILTSAWWFFALILISSYTANLAAFLTVKKIATPIDSVTDLAQQNKIKYGTVKDTGVKNFFKNTQISYFAKMWAQMSEVEPHSMVDSEPDALHKVRTENYAFFWDSTVNKYLTQTDCELMEIGPAFDPKGFGIGVPPGASYLDQLSMAILRLSDRGVLENIQRKWWDISSCPDLSGGADETSSLQLDNVAGVFFIVVGGIFLASFVCLAKYCFPSLFQIPEMVTQKSFIGMVKRKAVNTDDDGVDAEQL
ncbi:glutamate receptor 8 [Elysia marginata]|uniref:Glutamate receptor 8 n=1 Tax=Elysia marginata TaxID=1093978 RepID=A0AAV4EAE5_9GAST|nr:glutamate receptor 8 [Elysia marginata]